MSADFESVLPVVHRDLVEALEGEATGAGVDSAEWRDKVSRAISTSAEGSPKKVGFAIAARYSESVVGRALMATIEVVSAERVWSTVLPLIFARLRRDLRVQWQPVSEGVGRLVADGRRALPPEVTLGALDFFAEHTHPRSQVELVECVEQRMVVELRWR